MRKALRGKDKISIFIAVMVLFAGICCFLPISNTFVFYSHFHADYVQTLRNDLYEPIKVTRTEELNRLDGSLPGQEKQASGVKSSVVFMPVAVLFLLLCRLLFQTFCSIAQRMGIPHLFCYSILRYQHEKDGKKSI